LVSGRENSVEPVQGFLAWHGFGAIMINIKANAMAFGFT
jgi:hypothetical protein